MPTRKIAEPPPPPCRHPDHNPPNMMVYPPGTYEHVCSGCGARTVFTVSPVYCGGGGVKRPTGCGRDDDHSWVVKQRSYKGSLLAHVSDDNGSFSIRC